MPSEVENTLSRHPITIVLISFVLTGVLGAFLGQWFSTQAKMADQTRSATENRKAGIQNLSRYIYERRTRAVLLYSAIARRAQIEEIKERKKSYDDAYVRWNSDLLANSFMIREIDGQIYSFIEGAVQVLLVQKYFTPLDSCLTRAFDEIISGGPGAKIVEECKAQELLQQSLTCGYLISDELYKLSSRSTTRRDACEVIGLGCSGSEPFDKQICQ